MFHYIAFGLYLASDVEIPELLKGNNLIPQDFTIRQAPESESTSWPIENKFSYSQENKLYINIPDVVLFCIENGKSIQYKTYEHTNNDEFRLFLLGSCFGAILQQRGYIVLHGNAITTDSKVCTIFVGDQGAGKSTTATWFVHNGAYVLADDVCAITFDEKQRATVIPSFPQLKIWQNTADMLKIKTSALRRIRPQDAKFALPIHHQFYAAALPIQEIIELKKEPDIEKTITGLEKFKTLIKHSYRYFFLEQQDLQLAYNHKLLRLASMIQFKSITREKLVQLN